MSDLMICPEAVACERNCEHKEPHEYRHGCDNEICEPCIPYDNSSEVNALAMRLRCVGMFAFYRVGKRTPPCMTEWKELDADLKAAYMAQATEVLKMRGAR